MTPTPAWTARGPVLFARDLMRWENERRLTLAASGAAFWLCLAAFPAAIALVNILGLVVAQEDAARIVSDFALLASTEVGRVLEVQLLAVAAPSPGTLLVDTLLVLLALGSVSRAMRYLIDAIRAAHGMPKRSAFPHYAVSLAAGLLAVLGLGVISYLVKVLGEGPTVLLDLLAFALAIALVVALYATALGRTFQMRAAVPGVAVSAVGFVLVVMDPRLPGRGRRHDRDLRDAGRDRAGDAVHLVRGLRDPARCLRRCAAPECGTEQRS